MIYRFSHSIYYANTELSYVLAFTFFIVLMFVRPRGILSR